MAFSEDETMTNSRMIYREKGKLTVKFMHSKCKEYLEYDFTLSIRDSSKNPIELVLKFTGIYPDMAPMPPEENSFKAETIMNLHSKLMKWFNKYGYDVT